jgi:CHAD domain-containing protein
MVTAGLPAAEALRRLLSVQYKTVLANVAGACAGADVEYLHRLRVAVRRCRHLLRVFAPVTPASASSLVAAWGWLGDALGPARDLDVWVELLRSLPVGRGAARPRGWSAFVRHYEGLRRRQLAVVRRQLRSRAWQRLRARMARLLRRELPGREGKMALPALAARAWRKEVRRVWKRAQYRKSRQAGRRHELRCALRRARYTGEFFGEVLGQSAGKWVRRLHRAERPLARWHDLDVAEELMGRGGPAAPAALGRWLRQRRKELQQELRRAWRDLEGLPAKF